MGSETSKRKWVKREIAKAWDGKIGVLGIRIHKLLGSDVKAGVAGANPFDEIGMANGGKLSSYVTLYDPAGVDSKAAYATISDNMTTWINAAIASKLK